MKPLTLALPLTLAPMTVVIDPTGTLLTLTLTLTLALTLALAVTQPLQVPAG